MNPVAQWILSGPSGLGASGDSNKPGLEEAYAVYLGMFAPNRSGSEVVGPLADFVEVLRQNDKDTAYSDEEWIAFFTQFTEDGDLARDTWDALLCQPSYT